MLSKNKCEYCKLWVKEPCLTVSDLANCPGPKVKDNAKTINTTNTTCSNNSVVSGS